jgi:hypothetical protein
MRTALNSRKEQLLVVVHDAGGASVIAHYLKNKKPRFVAYAGGPARAIFRELGIPTHSLGASSDVKKVVASHAAKTLLTATGWMTQIERDALASAKDHGMHTIVYLDSWNDYRERFGFPSAGWRENLPAEIWAGDSYAYALAKKYFKRVRIRAVPNRYFTDLTARYRKERKRSDALVLMGDAVPGVAEKFARFLNGLHPEHKRLPIIIRPHPAEKTGTYRALMLKWGKRIRISRNTDIVKDLARAKVVIGTESVAMVAALLVGKRVISIAHMRREPFLPYKKILRVDKPEDAAELI